MSLSTSVRGPGKAEAQNLATLFGDCTILCDPRTGGAPKRVIREEKAAKLMVPRPMRAQERPQSRCSQPSPRDSSSETRCLDSSGRRVLIAVANFSCPFLQAGRWSFTLEPSPAPSPLMAVGVWGGPRDADPGAKRVPRQPPQTAWFPQGPHCCGRIGASVKPCFERCRPGR